MKCLIMERHPLTMLAIELVVGKYFPNWEIATASCLDEALECVTSAGGQPVTMLLAGLNVPGGAALSLIRHVQTSGPAASAACIAMADERDHDTANRCLAAGATTVFDKTGGLDQLVYTIQSALDASMRAPYIESLGESVGGPLGESLKTPQPQPAPPIRLTSRQRDVAKLVLAGYSNKKISYTLNLSYGTIKNYMFGLMRLLSVNSRLEMVLRIQEQGLFCHLHGAGNDGDMSESLVCDCSGPPALGGRRPARVPMQQHLRGGMYVAP
jgi:two-component system nitrate/nitrite response regulator NarL